MLIAALTLTASIHASAAVEIDLSRLFNRAATRQVQGLTCGIRIVGYRFLGEPGQTFSYAGDTYEIPSEGYVELIADRGRQSYKAAGRTLSLAGLQLDQFGFGEVTLPSAK